MRRELGQLSFDGLVEGGAGRNRQLERIAARVDWASFARLLGEIYAAPVGRPSYGPLVLLRCLLLQQWYRLSDPGLEEALADRLSFRRFVGLALADPVPDHSTLSRFRSELVRRGLSERLLAELNRQLNAKGLMVKTGTLIDASLVAADARRPRKDEPKERRSDPDASWNAMPEQPLFGYKMHLAVDQGSGLVRQAILTPANVSDKTPFLDLVQGDEQAVLADKGYDGWWYRQELARRGIADGINGRQLLAAAARCRRPRPQPGARQAAGAGRAQLRDPQVLVRLPPGTLPLAAPQRAAIAAARARPQPAPRARADRLRADGAPTMAAAPAMVAKGHKHHPAPGRSAPLRPFLRRRGTNSAITQSSHRALEFRPTIG
jgi:transposase, IS5 family